MPRSAATSRRQLVSWPLYRLLAVIALVPVLVAALTVREPSLPPPPAQPLAPFDGSAAATTAAAMVTLPRQQNGRGPGSAGDLAAAAWVRSQLEQAGYDPVECQPLDGFLPGRRPDVIAVFAHHDGLGTGVDDNAAAVGVMLELAKELQPLARERGLLFVSTDGGTSGGQGATYFAEHSPFARRISSAISLDSLAAKPGSPLRIVIRPDTVRGTSPTLFRTARAVASRVTGRSPDVPGVLDQLSGLAVPYALGEQGRVRELLEQAGFTEVRVDALELRRRHASFDELWEATLDLSRIFHDAVMPRPADELAEIRASLADHFARFASSDGSLDIPARTLVASATA